MTIYQAISLLFVLLLTPTLGCTKNQTQQIPSRVTQPSAGEDPNDGFVDGVNNICSALDFENVTWPKSYTEADQVAFALAMNITGSFEGHAGWTNLSNNFDGQGVSMGILNQNLGQGTLQPLLLTMRERHLEVLKKAMTQGMLDSLLTMLDDWEKANPDWDSEEKKALRQLVDVELDRDLVLARNLNIDKKYIFTGLQTRSNSKSVRWARKNLYTDSKGRNFKEVWKSALKSIAGDPAYVSQQIRAAQYIHDRAMGYKDEVQWKQLRSYLFLFDIVVQNGSLREKHFKKFDRWLKKNPQATEEQQMLEMLEIRVVDSNPKWQKDVRLRKTAVILGKGFVHGEDRNLPEEYCYEPTIAY